MRDNGIVFVAGIKLEDLEKACPLGGRYIVDENKIRMNEHLICKDFIGKIEVYPFTDFYHRNDWLRFGGIEWNVNQLDNYSNIGSYIVFISKDKGKAINKIAELYKTPRFTRNKILEGGYFD